MAKSSHITDQELRDLVAETTRAVARMSDRVDKVSEEIGYIGNSFGRFTEGLFTPSLDRILVEDMGMEAVSHRFRRQSNGSTMEVDVLGYSNGKNNTAIVVEIKSRLRDRDFEDFKTMLAEFPKVFVEHSEKKIIGMMAAVNISAEQRAKLEKGGIYVVEISADVFRVVSGRKFKPKDFGLKP